jgi:hypothetical protein
VNSKYVIPFMLAAGLFYAFNYNNKATMGFITNEAKDCKLQMSLPH